MLQLADLNPHHFNTTPDVIAELLTTYTRVKIVEAKWIAFGGAPGFVATSGLRSPAFQLDLVMAGQSTAIKSKHITGQACDIQDPDNKLKEWLITEPSILEDSQLWCEHWTACNGWCHFQTVPPKSGHRWFFP